jgi:hypothetical protein
MTQRAIAPSSTARTNTIGGSRLVILVGIVCLLSLVLAVPLRAQQPDSLRWHFITRTTAFAVSLDTATIQKGQDPGHVVAWLRFYFNRMQRGTPASDGKPFRYVLDQTEYDCSARQMSLRNMNFYSRDGVLLSTVNAVDTRDGLPQDVIPSSTGETIHRFVCDWAARH